VKLFAQHGFSDGFKTVEGLRKDLIEGVIFSPRDITPEKLRECASKFTESAPISERLFDPQYYATLSALDPGFPKAEGSGAEAPDVKVLVGSNRPTSWKIMAGFPKVRMLELFQCLNRQLGYAG
jgi:hypothetical protein